MQGAIDAAGFIHSRKVFWTGVVVARFEFLERNLIGRVAVYFVGAHEDEYGFGRVLPRGLEKVHGTKRINFEIEDRNVARLIMRRLCSTMNDQVEATLPEHLANFRAIA